MGYSPWGHTESDMTELSGTAALIGKPLCFSHLRAWWGPGVRSRENG